MIQKFLHNAQTNTTRVQYMLAGLALLATYGLSASETTISNNLFLHRAFSANIEREMMMEGHITKTDFDGFYSFFAATGAYQRSWNQNGATGIGALPFWSGTNAMTVGTNLNGTSLDAYQFGLGNVTSNGQIELNPIVYQGGADFLFYAGGSTNDPGFFIKLKAPLGMIGINPQLTEVTTATAAPYVAGAIQPSTTTGYQPSTTMTQAFAGASNTTDSGDFKVMEYGLIDGLQSSGAKFGDFEMTLGYNLICDEEHLFGFGLRASGPSGNKPLGIYALEPIFGRGSSWGIGGYLVGGIKVWENHENKYFAINVMGTILHLVTSNTVRSYDLELNGPGSKYLLVADYNANIYQGTIQNLINLSTLDSTSSFAAEGNAAIEFQYVSNGWEVDLGYAFWGRTQEHLTITQEFDQNRYAILGRQSVGAFNGSGAATPSTLSQPSARINSSLPAVALDGNTGATAAILPATVPANRIAGNSAFNIAAAEQQAASTSKVFTKAAYSWLDMSMSPYVGLLGEFEISTSQNNALSQWSIAVVGGLYF